MNMNTHALVFARFTQTTLIVNRALVFQKHVSVADTDICCRNVKSLKLF